MFFYNIDFVFCLLLECYVLCIQYVEVCNWFNCLIIDIICMLYAFVCMRFGFFVC